jgi:diguanylate cyclase (GGDEF)-like protein
MPAFFGLDMSEKLVPAKEEMLLPSAAQAPSLSSEVRFAPQMELAFQQEMDGIRCDRIKRTGIAAVALYALFAITDRTMLPDAYTHAWAIRFFLVIPLLVLCTLGIASVRRLALREILLAATVVIAGASIVWIAALSSPEYAFRYHQGIALIVLFGNLVLGLRFRSAVASSLLICALYVAALIRIDSVPVELRFSSWLIFAVAVAISLIANFRMDQDQRRAFLATAREHERNEELSRAVERFGRLSAEDPLTELANRREFDRRLELEWGRARREGRPMALIMVDVDFFKDYNDLYGHQAGDACLQRIAAILRSIPQRSSDLAARLGGEEFGVMLPGTTLDSAAELAEQMRTVVLELNLPHASSSVTSVVSASFGVSAAMPASRDEPAALFANADAALYDAKKNGRNRVEVRAG